TITATDVQNSLVRNRREQLKHRGAEIGDETSVLLISRGVPGLWVHGIHSGTGNSCSPRCNPEASSLMVHFSRARTRARAPGASRSSFRTRRFKAFGS